MPLELPCASRRNEAEIVICGRDNSARYRLPDTGRGFDPGGVRSSVSRERNALMEGGEVGIGSCSNVGPGGWTGCFAIDIKRAQQQRAGR